VDSADADAEARAVRIRIMEVGCTGVESAALMDAASKVNYGKK
jgi:hypothetical protein